MLYCLDVSIRAEVLGIEGSYLGLGRITNALVPLEMNAEVIL